MKRCPRCLRPFVDTQDACPLDEALLEFEPVQPPENLGRELGNYRLIGLLGEGGMGNVYIGAHTRLNRYVAIKLLKPELKNRGEAISRFFDEAQTVNKAKHPNIVESIDLVDDVVDGAYCVLELLRGVDLQTRLASGRLSIGSAVQIATQIADALGVVHALDIVHRDLKPQNLILIERDGRDDFVKLIDFGVAQMSEDGAGGDRPFGTPAYMAPEQAAGERVDGRADVYSLGVVLFEMVTGRHPFPATNEHEFLLRHADDPPPRPSKVAPSARIPKQLESIILRCLEKKPRDRYEDAAAVATALRLVDHRPSRSKLWVAAALLVAAGTAAALVVPDLLAGRNTDSAQVATGPAALAPATAPAPSEPPPAMSELNFESTPPGAKVYREGETVALGVTPFSIKLRSTERPTQVRFELAGYETMVVAPSEDAVVATLIAVKQVVAPKQIPKAKPKTSTEIQREGVMDPFAQAKKK